MEAYFSRDVSALSKEKFDLLIIGGGINGAAVAWDAALRGLKVALVERGDFGAGASSGCFKIVHSGLRYLQHLDISRLRESVIEQRVLRKIAPHLVHPLAFMIPCYGYAMKSKGVLKLGMTLFEMLSHPRNAEVDGYHFLPKHQILSKEQCLNIAPGLNQKGLKGGVVYYDCQMSNCERLTLSIIKAAAKAGATVCNYAEVLSGEIIEGAGDQKRIKAVQVKDLLSGNSYRVKANVFLNAAGPWISQTLQRVSGVKGYEYGTTKMYSKGIQIVLPEFIKSFGVAVESSSVDEDTVVSRGGRSLFVFPWRGRSLIGTSDELVVEEPDKFAITPAEIGNLVQEARTAYNSPLITEDNVKFAFGGFRPVERKYQQKDFEKLKDKNLATVSRDDLIIDHAGGAYNGFSTKIENLISTEGVKYTTFRGFGEKATNLVEQKVKGQITSSKTADTQIAGGEIESYKEFLDYQISQNGSQLSKEIVVEMVRDYGSETKDVIDTAEGNQDLLSTIEGTLVTKAAVLYAVRYEMANTVADVVLRRTGLGTIGYPGDDAMVEVATIMGTELGWSRFKQEEEVHKTRQAFLALGIPT